MEQDEAVSKKPRLNPSEEKSIGDNSAPSAEIEDEGQVGGAARVKLSKLCRIYSTSH